MKIAIWFMVTLVAIGAIGGAVYLGTHDFDRRGRDRGEDRPSRDLQVKNPQSGGETSRYTLEVDGIEREFIVYRPASVSNGEEVPLMFMFHGSSGTGEKMYRTTGWNETADEEGFIVVYPTSLEYYIFDEEKVIDGEVKTNRAVHNTRWNSYDLQTQLNPRYPDQVLADDVQFTQDMVDFMKENYPVDSERIYATGFSNGAQFVSRLIVEKSDVFAAYAMTGGGHVAEPVMAKFEELGQYPTPRPVIHMMGSVDKSTYVFDVEEYRTDESGAEDGNPLKDYFMDSFITTEQLADEYDYEHVMNSAHFTYDESLVGADNEYHFYVVEGMGHMFPNGENFSFDARELFWSFFEEHTL